jgi:hypothetical protein
LGQIESVKCNMTHEGFATTHNRIQYMDELIHEHQFIPTKLRQQTCCVTCGKCYCNKCGKLLEKEATPEAL